MSTALQPSLTKSSRSKEALATWYVVSGGADTYWRAEMPARHVGAKIVSMTDKEAHKQFQKPGLRRKFPWVPTDEGARYPGHQGVAVWTRPDMRRATHACAMAANGIRVVAEVDDNYLSPTDQNIFMRMSGYDDKGRSDHMKAFATMDAIICSTTELRDEYTRTFKKYLRHVPDMYVARNHIDLDDWRTPQKDWGRIRVGIMGSHQHIWDWRLAAPALHLAKMCGSEIVFIGLDPAEHDPKWKEFLGEYTHIPWADPEEYHQKGLPLDIGLIPLVYNKHTLGKSDLKFLEYSMSGIATVAQNHPIYNKTIKHGETGLLAGSPDEMALMVQKLILDTKLRRTLVANAQQYVREERTIQKNKHEWEDAILGR